MAGEDTLTRLVRLETAVDLKFKELDRALVLARELSSKDREIATEVLNRRLEGMNEFRAQMNKQEASYATKQEIRAVERLVWIGIGLLVALQFLAKWIKF
jgi:CHASE3 domain sensor protein